MDLFITAPGDEMDLLFVKIFGVDNQLLLLILTGRSGGLSAFVFYFSQIRLLLGSILGPLCHCIFHFVSCFLNAN